MQSERSINTLYSFCHLKYKSGRTLDAKNRSEFHLGLAGLVLALGLSYGLLYLFSASGTDVNSHSGHFIHDDECWLCVH